MEGIAKKSTVLVVDDSSSVLGLLEDILSHKGYRVLLASDGETALRMARLTTPDLILLDLMMPIMNGIEVCKRLKRDSLTQEIPVVFITVDNDPQTVMDTFSAGGVDHITKPLRQQEVLARIEAHIMNYYFKRELIKSSELNRRIINAIPDLIFSIDSKHIIRGFQNSESVDLYVAPSKFLGKTIETILPPSVAEMCANRIDLSLQTKKPQIFEYQLVVDEKIRDYEARITPYGDEEVLSIIRDITDRKQKERELVELQKYLFSILELSMDSIVSTDPNQQIIHFSSGAEEVFSYSANEAIGKPFDFLLSEDCREECRKYLDRFMASENSTDKQNHLKELKGLHKNASEFPIEMTISKFRSEGKFLLTAVIREKRHNNL